MEPSKCRLQCSFFRMFWKLFSAIILGERNYFILSCVRIWLMQISVIDTNAKIVSPSAILKRLIIKKPEVTFKVVKIHAYQDTLSIIDTINSYPYPPCKQRIEIRPMPSLEESSLTTLLFLILIRSDSAWLRWVCEQQRRRPACAFAQSDQRL